MKKLILSIIRKFDLYKHWIAFRENYYPTPDMKRKTAFYRQFISPNMLCFDVGANMGNRVVTFLSLGAKVVALEPQKKCFDYLYQRFKNKAVIIRKGVSDKIGSQQLLVSDASLLSSFSKDWVASIQDKFGHHNWDKTEEVAMTTLDALIAEYGQPDFIKIDVEGYELEVLEGLNHAISAISFEYSCPYYKEKTLKCFQKLDRIMPNAQYNYSKGETFEFVSKQWLSNSEIYAIFENFGFADNGFGDVYLKN
jgi:FkbM family methyltransferase